MKETPEQRRSRFLSTAKAAVSNAYATDEHAIMQAINSYNAIDKIKNMTHERLEEWYSIYFPELKMSNQVSYAKFVMKFGANKKDATKEELSNLVGADIAGDIYLAIQSSIGREPSPGEFETIKKMAESELMLDSLSGNIDMYLMKSTKTIMPNIVHLIDYKIAAELLAKAGSLNRLAMMPASTVQLLGAEKALFKHIKFGSRSPKYGVLFKLPEVTAAPKRDKGRLARLYATKICIAAKADAFSHNFIAEDLKKSIELHAKNIKDTPRSNSPPSNSQGKNQAREPRWQKPNRKSFGAGKGKWGNKRERHGSYSSNSRKDN